MPIRARFRTVFISDLHLGASATRADECARFLKRIECGTLYLVGDVLDMWRLRRRWCWPAANNRVVNRIMKMARRGTRVVYIPGNHDEHARRYAGLVFGGVEVLLREVHVAADGRSILVTHGDQFDLVVRHARLLSLLGAWAYDRLVWVNQRCNWVRGQLGLRYWSLAQFLKMRVKAACTHISRFEEVLVAEARRHGCEGVVCGHIHKAEVREGPVSYYNCGDWVESASALVEHLDGRFELIDGVAVAARVDALRAADGESIDVVPVGDEAGLVDSVGDPGFLGIPESTVRGVFASP